MNEFKFSCPHCQQNIQATPEYSGIQINCPNCQRTIVVPDAQVAAAAPKPGKLTMAASTVQHAATSPVMATTMARKAKKPPVKLYVGLGVGALAVVAAIIFVPKALDKYQQHKADVAAAAEAKAKAEQAKTNAPPDLEVDEILKRVGETYKGLTSYKAQGDSVSTMDMSQISPMLKDPQKASASLSILLGKPDLYRIEWDRQGGPKSMKGAAWSSGKGDYVRTVAGATKYKTRDLALGMAGASSGTLGAVLAGLFFNSTNSLTVALKNYAKSKNETLNGRKCYVVTGQAASQNLQFWIHKDDFLIAQVEVVLGGKMDDSVLAGLNAAQKAQAQMMSKVKGNIIETYQNIETNKVLNPGDFEVAIAPSATPKVKQPRQPKTAGVGRPGPKPQ